jgi:hypothetical protein
MSPASTAKINQAVDDCLEKCASTAAPFSLLRDYLKELEDSGAWTPEEVAAVEQAAPQILSRQ